MYGCFWVLVGGDVRMPSLEGSDVRVRWVNREKKRKIETKNS
jgi:hypothetical protein